MTGSESYQYTRDSQDMLDSTNSDSDFMNTGITEDESHQPISDRNHSADTKFAYILVHEYYIYIVI